jgi:hypothetical protein
MGHSVLIHMGDDSCGGVRSTGLSDEQVEALNQSENVRQARFRFLDKQRQAIQSGDPALKAEAEKLHEEYRRVFGEHLQWVLDNPPAKVEIETPRFTGFKK